jgi:cytochrome c oxidase cbb3-type subunit 4
MLAQLHSWWTVLLLVVFVGIVIWAYSSKRRADFDEAARLALDDDDLDRASRKNTTEGLDNG